MPGRDVLHPQGTSRSSLSIARVSDHIPHVFQSLWIGRYLSPLEHLCISSFLAHGYTFVLYAYDRVENVPPACQVEDAREILPEEDIFVTRSGYHIGSPSVFSDRFRYELLRARGGWWVDTDTLCLKSDIPETPYVFAMEDENGYGNGVLKAPADSALVAKAVSRCVDAHGETEFGAIGPALLDELVRELSLEGQSWARDDLYPLVWHEFLRFFDPAQTDAIEARVSSSTFVHFFGNMLRVANVLKDVKPPETSYLDRLYRNYEIGFPTDRRYEWSELEPQFHFQEEHWQLGAEIAKLRAEVQQLRAELERGPESKRARLGSSLAQFLDRAK
jgi:hypothetical protein